MRRDTACSVFINLLRKKELSLFSLNFHFCIIPEMEHLFRILGIFCEYPTLSSSHFSMYLPSFNFNGGVHKHSFSTFMWSRPTVFPTMAVATETQITEVPAGTILQLYCPCAFMFRPLTHLHIPFVCDVRVGSDSTFLQVTIQLTQRHGPPPLGRPETPHLSHTNPPRLRAHARLSRQGRRATGLLPSQGCLFRHRSFTKRLLQATLHTFTLLDDLQNSSHPRKKPSCVGHCTGMSEFRCMAGRPVCGATLQAYGARLQIQECHGSPSTCGLFHGL